MKTRVVYFTKNNARVLINPENLDLLSSLPNVVINPDLTHVQGFPTHFWKLKDGKILPMIPPEREARLEHIKKHGIDNKISLEGAVKPVVKRKFRLPAYGWFIVGSMVGSAITLITQVYFNN